MMASAGHESKQSEKCCAWCHLCKVWWDVLKWLPVLLIVTVIVWSYYAYVFQLCIYTIDSFLEKLVYLILYHVLLLMFTWSYWQTVFTNLVPIPDMYKIPESEMEKLFLAQNEEAQREILDTYAKNLPVVTRTMSGAVRYCNRCMHVKPDRAHHCSMCGRCVLKMDHHCPWVNNCVCFHNYKFFILFLGYSLFYCLFIMLTTFQYFIKFWKGDMTTGMGRYHIVFVFFVALMFAISLGSLFGYHCYLVLHNRSTLEAFRPATFRSGPDKNGFSIGTLDNFKEVFGPDVRRWFLPVFTSLGDGCVYPVRREHQLQTFTAPPQDVGGYESMGTTRSGSEAEQFCKPL